MNPPNTAGRGGALRSSYVRKINNRVQATAWTGWFGGDEDDGESSGYVKINIVHTEKTERIAVALMRKFVCEGTSLGEMDAVIGEIGLDEEPG